MKTLSGLNVLILRSSRPDDPLADQLKVAGATVMSCPILAINRVDVDPEISSARYDKVIFVSRHAVSYGLESLRLTGMDFNKVAVAAVGPTTAAALKDRGVDALHPTVLASTEGLLELPEMSRVEGQRILIVRGQGGREALKDTLLERGAEVRYCEVYGRAADFSYLDAISTFWGEGEPVPKSVETRAVIIHSGEIAAAYASLLELVATSAEHSAWELPCITPGVRVAEVARTLGFRQVFAASSAVAVDMEQALRCWYTGKTS